ncbi:hypothetical protein RND71_042597 [Anisodus tanguticus]|uniref:Uncharacterized protein n=1 Tax=Anisodus tanguticus TaxID=243964 RepID=A0AAE1UUT6_9SOLA|nr:hypothetical protein RND71_042597 [Anisodus tanguticus]
MARGQPRKDKTKNPVKMVNSRDVTVQGSGKGKAKASEVVADDEDLEWPELVSNNKPRKELRWTKDIVKKVTKKTLARNLMEISKNTKKILSRRTPGKHLAKATKQRTKGERDSFEKYYNKIKNFGKIGNHSRQRTENYLSLSSTQGVTKVSRCHAMSTTLANMTKTLKGMQLPPMFDVEVSSLYAVRRNQNHCNGTIMDLGSFGDELLGLRQTIPGDSSPGPSALLPVNRGICLNEQGLRTEQLISPTRSHPRKEQFAPTRIRTHAAGL